MLRSALKLAPLGEGFGMEVPGVDLSRPLTDAEFDVLRDAFFAAQVLVLRAQRITAAQFLDFARRLGSPEPHVIDQFHHPEHPDILILSNVSRDGRPLGLADAGTYFHTDYSYLEVPARATMLYSIQAPSRGGDTLFANQYAAWDGLPASTKALLKDRMGIHSARRGYSPQGRYGEKDKGRSMAIKYDDSAMATQLQPIARIHPETGRTALYVSPGYTIGIDGMPDTESGSLLDALFAHQARPEFVYRHRWSQGMLVMWDNRCVVHAATGGYQGHRRLLHRITVGDRTAGAAAA